MLTGQTILGYAVEAKLDQHPLGELHRGIQITQSDAYRTTQDAQTQTADIKVLEPDLAADAQLRQRFIREVALLQGLNHQGLVQVIDAQTEGEVLALVTEYVGGFTLKDILERRTRLSFAEALVVIPRLLETVEYTHQAGAVHWALNPGLIRLEPNGNTRVSDLGVARILAEAWPARADASAVYYAAPEQVQVQGEPDHRTDIYALGVVLYEALTGRVPFFVRDSTDANEINTRVREAHISSAPPDPRDFRPALPNGMAAALLKALDKDPAARFQSAAEMLVAVKQAEWGRVTLPTGRAVPGQRRERPTASHAAVSSDPPTQQAAATPARAEVAFPVDTYRLVCRKFRESGQIDRAWCICAVLSYLKQAEPEEQQFYEQHRPAQFVMTRASLNQDLWRHQLIHPESDRFIGAVMGTIAPTVGVMMARPHRVFGLRHDDRRDLATDQLLFSRLFRYVAEMLGVVQPDLYLKPDQQTGLLMAHTVDVPSFVVGAELLRGRSEDELAFTIGWHLSYLRPEHFLCNVLGEPSKFKAVFYAAMKVAEPGFPVPQDDVPAVEQTIKSMKRKLHSSITEHLARLVSKYDAVRTGSNLGRWWSMVELTANRTGLVACNNLEVAAAKILTSPVTVGSLSPAERLMDVLLFMVSENYSKIRAQLGLAVG